MVPYSADKSVRLNPSDNSRTGFNHWPSGFKKENYAFAGSVYDGQSIWLIPYNADQVVKLTSEDIEQQKPFTVKEITLTDLSGNSITPVGGESVLVKMEVEKYISGEIPSYFIIALYKENQFMDMAIISSSFPGSGTYALGAYFKLPENLAGCELKAYVFDNFKHIRPLSNSVSFILGK